jgi:hypothetical protein
LYIGIGEELYNFRAEDRAVLFNTGSAYKCLDVLTRKAENAAGAGLGRGDAIVQFVWISRTYSHTQNFQKVLKAGLKRMFPAKNVERNTQLVSRIGSNVMMT